MSRVVGQISIATCVTMLVLSLSRADDRPRAPIPRAPLPSPVIIEPAKPDTPAKPEQSDLHSHLCSNARCRHEWWHDPRKGPVSHNCPKCGREQWVINRRSPPAPRDIAPPAASPRQESRGAASDKVVYVVGSTNCGACAAFFKKHRYGDDKQKYVYAYMDKPRPADIPAETWDIIVRHNNTLKFTWPFFVMRIDGEVIAVQARVE